MRHCQRKRSCAWCGQKFDEMAEIYSFPGETYRPPNEEIMKDLSDAKKASEKDTEKALCSERQLSLFDIE